MKTFRSQLAFWLAGTLLGSTAGYAQSTPAVAPAIAEDDGGLGAIIVTARRQFENLQRVPLAVTVLSGDDLTKRSIKTLIDVEQGVPNLHLWSPGAYSSALIYVLRGQTNAEILPTQDAAVGVYVDDIVWNRPIGVNGGLYDTSSIQVLRGPQGTLFGRNTTGGAIVIETNDPTFEGVSGWATLGYGSNDAKTARGALNLPASDKIAFRIAGTIARSDGMYRNLTRNIDEGTEHYEGARAKMLFEPTDDVRLSLAYEYFNMDQQGTPWQLVGFMPGTAADFQVAAQGGVFGPIQNALRGKYDESYGGSPQTHFARTHTATGKLNWSLGAADLKAILGYRSVNTVTFQDIDGNPYDILIDANDGQRIKQYSGELQLSGQAREDALKYTLGLYAFREKGDAFAAGTAIPGVNPFNPNITSGDIKNQSEAIYGQATYALSQSIRLTGGLRYSWEKKSMDSHNSVAGACIVPVELQSPVGSCSTDLSRSDSGLSYLASIDWDVAPGVLLYAKTARAFRSGGHNLRGTDAVSYTPFGAERITEYEIGLKSSFLNNRVRFNVAAYYDQGDDIQRVTNVFPVINGQTLTSTIVSNSAKARFAGGEAELQALIAEGLRISGSLGLTFPKYKSFTDLQLIGGVPTVVDRSGEPFNYISKRTLSGSVDYTRDIGVGELNLRGDVSYSSKQSFAQGIAPEFTDEPGYTLVNARISLKPNESLEFAVFGKNIFNSRYDVNAYGVPAFGYYAASPGARRTWGLEATARF